MPTKCFTWSGTILQCSAQHRWDYDTRNRFCDPSPPLRYLPLYEREKNRSLKVDPPSILPPVYVAGRVGPTFPEGATFSLQFA